MMKKILALVLAACMLLALCACGAGSETTSTTAAGGSGEPAANTGVGGTAYPNPLQDVRVRQALCMPSTSTLSWKACGTTP